MSARSPAFDLAEYGIEGLTRGEPVTLYHGTTRTFSNFDVSKSRTDLVDQFYGAGIFLTPSKKVAWSYADANRNIGFDPEIILDLEGRNPKAGRFMRLLYEKGNDAWDMFPREFFGMGPNDSYMEAFEKYVGGVDPNTIADVARLIIGSKLPHGLEEDETLNIFSTSTGLPDYIYKSLDEIGLDSRIYRPKVYTVEVKVSKPLVTASKAAAKSARKKGYDSVIFYGEDLVSGVPEVAVFDPRKVKIKGVEVEETIYENPSSKRNPEGLELIGAALLASPLEEMAIGAAVGGLAASSSKVASHPMSLQAFLRKPNPSSKRDRPGWSSGKEEDRREANFVCPRPSRGRHIVRRALLAAGVPKSEMTYYPETRESFAKWFAKVKLSELIAVDNALNSDPSTSASYEALDMTLHWDYQLTFDETMQYLVGKKNPAATAEKIITSAATSRPQVPALFKALVESCKIGMGSVVLDVGAGRYDLGKEYLEDNGIVSAPYDPYNRSEEENIQALNVARSGRVDACMCANVLNVIAYPDHRAHVIWLCANAVRASGASAWFSIHEGDRSGAGRMTGPDSWQENRKAVSYLKEIREYFSEVQAKRLAGRTVIEASGPRSAA